MGSSFEDLEVWKKSCRLSVRLYKLLVTVCGFKSLHSSLKKL
jgi:hypothetical protein